MATTQHIHRVPSSRSAQLSTLDFPRNPRLIEDTYEIENIHTSENAWLLFTRHTETNKHVVMKLLRPYEDARYRLKTVEARQRCQLEAIWWNRQFTQGVHIGLAPLGDFALEQRLISIGKTLEYPSKKMLYPLTDYALLMHELRKENRLDSLLREGNPFSRQNNISHQYYLRILARYMEYMHRFFVKTVLPLNREGGGLWGSVEQLRTKLEHNFSLVNPSVMTNEDPEYSKYYKTLKDTLNLLKEDLSWVFADSDYKRYFEQRRQKSYIRRCHGDLKARNIWIDPQRDDEPWKCVTVLDAVDFNSMYSNIDILSDFAMLVVDVEVRTKSSFLANRLVEEYLHFTGQEDEVSRSVLAYYLVEKAFIGGIVNIIYDSSPGLGQDFLEVAEKRLEDVKRK
jgi:aminoglycoside phosphotransferase family enzyme